ncbi:MAG: FAD-binding protein, partial [Bacteroidetes bacterium]|nr:FAD-binding protein [Bacteroidota bacterium]
MSKTPDDLINRLHDFSRDFEGEIFSDTTSRLLHATDASAYREVPLAVARPKNKEDIRKLIQFANANHTSLIPRTAGTSLAGQVVGGGIVVDVSRYMTRILEMNVEEHWIRVEPGVILDELNKYAAYHGLFFGPETSTSSRCMIGGMIGNNSCGAHSLIYGSTRDHLLSVKAFLSDGSEVEFHPLTADEFISKTQQTNLEGSLYRQIHEILSDTENQAGIRKEYPDPAIHRRNTGYAIDLLLETEPFTPGKASFNFCQMMAGSEGTLAFITEAKLNLVPLPPKEKALLCVHCKSVEEALQGNLVALKFSPTSIELMDKAIMDCTKDNISQRKNRFFIEGDPGAILIIEFAAESRETITKQAEETEKALRKAGLGYHFPLVFPPDVARVWELRKAGLGVLSNYPGDRKPVPVTEDTAVSPEVLPEYIREFREMLNRFGLDCVYYAHIATGELHLRPVLNLKDERDVELFHTVALETAKLVKKYRGSLSGEHGDGRLRGEFIPLMIGEKNNRLLKTIKATWDPNNIFNPGKIVDTPKMNTSLRYQPGQQTRNIQTIFDFSASKGILRAAEQCNGSGDCRNIVVTGKRMCPSYMASLEENTTTRARANILREFLTNSTKTNPFDHREIYDIMDLCLSCKACKSECPSNVDITKLKAEFLQHYYDAHGIPFRTKLIAYITSINKLGMIVPGIFNFVAGNRITSGILKKTIGFASGRSIPLLYKTTLRSWFKAHRKKLEPQNPKGRIYLFADEFSDYNDVEIGIKAIKLLSTLGYSVSIPRHTLSGRTFLSKGLLRKAQKIATLNIHLLKDIITPETPLLGIEPSAILAFRDEYPDLAGAELKPAAQKLAANCWMLDEFISSEFEKGNISRNLFSKETKHIRL